MADVVLQHNVGAYGSLRGLSAVSSALAGGAGNNVEVTGSILDRLGFGGTGMSNSAVIGIVYSADLAAGKTLSLAYTIQTSDDQANWTPLASGASAVVATGPTGGGVVSGQMNVQVDLAPGGRYVQVLYTPVLNATSTDTAETVAVGFFAGFDVLPAPL